MVFVSFLQRREHWRSGNYSLTQCDSGTARAPLGIFLSSENLMGLLQPNCTPCNPPAVAFGSLNILLGLWAGWTTHRSIHCQYSTRRRTEERLTRCQQTLATPARGAYGDGGEVDSNVNLQQGKERGTTQTGGVDRSFAVALLRSPGLQVVAASESGRGSLVRPHSICQSPKPIANLRFMENDPCFG